MDIRLVLLSVACFCCMAPPAMTAPLLGTKVLAAVGGALAAKGLAVKGLAKGALIGGAAIFPNPLPPPIVVEEVVPAVAVPVPQPPSIVISPPSLSNIAGKVTGLVSASKNALLSKVAAFGDLIRSLLPTKTIVRPPPVVYEVLSEPKFYELPTPIIKKVVKK